MAGKKAGFNRELLIVGLAVFIVAFALRLSYLNNINQMPTFDIPVMDENYHLKLARTINAVGYPPEPYFRAPLYPYFLSGLLRITSNSLYGSRLIQIILGALLPVIVMLIGLRVLNKIAAYIAAFIAAVYPTFIYYDSALLITFLMTLLSALLIYMLYKAQEKRQVVYFIAGGLLLGLAALARPNILLFGPALFVWAWLTLRKKLGSRKTLIRYAVLGAVTCLIILPVTIRNYAVSGDFILISWQGGYNFFLGNNRYADGWSATSPGIDKSWEGGYNAAITIAEQRLNRKLKTSEVSGYWLDEGLSEVSSYPGNFVKLLVRKTRLIFNGYEIPNNQHLYMVKPFAGAVGHLLTTKPIYFPFGILAPLALIGIGLSLRKWRKFLLLYLFLGSYILSLILFFVCARFRQPLLPIMIIFAVYGIDTIVREIREKRYLKTAVVAITAIMLFAESNHALINLTESRVRADSEYVLGSSWLSHFKLKYGTGFKEVKPPYPSELVSAQDYLLESIKADPNHAMALNDLGTIAVRCHKWDAAEYYFGRALQADSSFYQPHINYARVLAANNKYDDALATLENAQAKFPFNFDVNFSLAQLCTEMGKYSEAQTALEQALRLNPNHPEARKMYSFLQTRAAK